MNEYTPIFTCKTENEDSNEYVERFKNFDINKLPLIEIAKALGFKIEKSNKVISKN